MKECIESARNQTNQDIAIIVVDDCGPDTVAAESYIRSLKDPRISFHKNTKNLGIGGNWNRCLELTSTPLTNILHADDRLLPNYADVMLSAAKKYPDATFFFCNTKIIDESGDQKFSFPDHVKTWIQPPATPETTVFGDNGLADLLRGCFIMCPTVCYRTDRVAGERFDTCSKQVLDFDFYSRLLFLGHELVGLADTCYLYRRHKENQTSKMTLTLNRFIEEIDLYEKIALKSSEKNWNKSMKVARQQTIIKLNLGYCVLVDLLKGQFAPAWRKFRYLVKILI